MFGFITAISAYISPTRTPANTSPAPHLRPGHIRESIDRLLCDSPSAERDSKAEKLLREAVPLPNSATENLQLLLATISDNDLRQSLSRELTIIDIRPDIKNGEYRDAMYPGYHRIFAECHAK